MALTETELMVGHSRPRPTEVTLEYRVRWQRVGQRTKTRIYQSREPADTLGLVIQGRLAEALDLDPDGYACCSGAGPCGCRGLTRAQVWAERTAQIPALMWGPVIEQREVGEWTPAVWS